LENSRGMEVKTSNIGNAKTDRNCYCEEWKAIKAVLVDICCYTSCDIAEVESTTKTTTTTSK